MSTPDESEADPESEYPQMERQPTAYFNDYTTYRCISCGRAVNVPDDQAMPVACPWRCKDA